MKSITSIPDIERVVKKYRKRLGIDSVYIIHLYIVDVTKKKNKHMLGTDAMVSSEETHPIAHMSVSSAAIKRFHNHPRCMIRLVVHELLHIVVGESFKDLKKSYQYDKDGLIEEALVTRLARAIVPLDPKVEDVYDGK